ncbi:MAG: hypothetical protein GY822_12300 [Deltaproteobacteria bacterium]|nr:hypothetical protein [Deltaproteobacteria bacterium]
MPESRSPLVISALAATLWVLGQCTWLPIGFLFLDKLFSVEALVATSLMHIELGSLLATVPVLYFLCKQHSALWPVVLLMLFSLWTGAAALFKHPDQIPMTLIISPLIFTWLLWRHTAARCYRFLAMGILVDGKSKAYSSAIRFFERLHRCYEAVEDPAAWDAVVEEVRASHGRKSSFMPRFEEVVGGGSVGSVVVKPVSFIEQARTRWLPKGTL